MDLGTILSKLNEERYENIEEFLDDFELIWDNCKNYNVKGTVPMKICSGSMGWQISWRKMGRKCSKITFPPFLFNPSVSHSLYRDPPIDPK
jgi:hypothetical protein